jgi:exodeoxyribonuclease VII large subunit
MEANAISLYKLQKDIQLAIKEQFTDAYWIIAEIAQIKENYSGHCYIELVEKDPQGEKIIAQAKATIWSYTYRILKPYFETTTGHRLEEGMKILVQVKIEYHEVYGFSLNIADIEPSFTIGDLAKKKAEIIKRLKDEGVFNMNKQVEFPIVPQRIAIISSETAAGYGDFIQQLANNPYHYAYTTKIYPAFMQGEKAEASIIEALEQIYNKVSNFDVVVIIRGGGSQTDLSCFDSYWLASHVAQFPLPVLTGIGHEQDESIVDMVAHAQLKTPTAVASHLIDCVSEFEAKIDSLSETLYTATIDIIDNERDLLNKLCYNLPIITSKIIYTEKERLNTLAHNSIQNSSLIFNTQKQYLYNLPERLKTSIKYLKQNNLNNISFSYSLLKKAVSGKINSDKQKLSIFANTCELSNPNYILKKGYSITLHNNKLITSATQINTNDLIETRLHDGTFESVVK